MGKKVITRRHYTRDEWDSILKMHQMGATLEEIGKNFDRTPAAINTIINRAAKGDEPTFRSDVTGQRPRRKRATTTSGDTSTLVSLIVEADIPKAKKIRALEALL